MSSGFGCKRRWVGADGFAEILAREHESIENRTGSRSKKIWTGVSLSGGGIRSAAFCLGALQALARSGVLSRIDYISTVSGGGYVGAGLQWLLCRDPGSDAGKQHFPYGVDADLAVHPLKGQSNLQYLRWHANYLVPGRGFDIFSALTVVVRTAFLSVAIWFPLIVLFFYALQLLASLIFVHIGATYVAANLIPSSIMTPSWTGDSACFVKLGDEKHLWPDKQGCISIFYGASFYIGCIGIMLLAVLSLFVAFISVTKFPEQLTKRFVLAAVTLGVIGILLLAFEFVLLSDLLDRLQSPIQSLSTRITVSDFIFAVVLLTLGSISLIPSLNLLGMLIFGETYRNADYSLRRTCEVVGGKLLKLTVFAIVFASIPAAYKYVFGLTSIPISAVSTISGLITALMGHLSQSKQIIFGAVTQVGLSIVACVFLYSVVLLGYHVNVVLYDPQLIAVHYNYGLIAAGVVVLSIIFGVSSNSNTTGLHRFYRDRLMELFMPSEKSTLEGRSTFSFRADRLSVSDAWQQRRQKSVGLFPIVNCNAILVNDRNPMLSRRGGASFAVTPLHIGGHEHGWETLESYEWKNRQVSLATAVAASGAAADANSGYAGAGITRNRAVSLVLTLFNIRLGVWLRRPSSSPRINLLKPTPFFPNLWYGPLSRGYTARSTFVEISDGGHFENLGVYELVRRKVDLIIALDGEADPTTALPALVNLSRRIEEDFSATMDFDTSPDAIMPFRSAAPRYPNDAQFASLPCVKATIRYANDPKRATTLIYVKASLIEETPFGARGYRAQHPEYPNESTANQFYSPEQFDAYRELGIACSSKAIKLHWLDIKSILRRRQPTA
ncbi:patatin-like phospholipase family protein [Bradyrhizobium sp.]|uniref:patatin-like phospholipase family protein n=1 Tax=Bradyrhizobium sp. TaxID=376 RepID=UPI002D6BBC50|nr:patatin-like phospholipase family protein [Bradyrhizobium sp.]HZR77337.1 patatin-like phospholipase family protein [Bradyrhizobium sp.]